MRHIDTLPAASSEQSRVTEEVRGAIAVQTLESDGFIPAVEAHIPRSGRSGIRSQLYPEKGIYGLQYSRQYATLTADTPPIDFTSRGVEGGTKKLRSVVTDHASPVVFTASNGVGVHAPLDSPFHVVKLSEQDDTAINLSLEGDDPMKQFVPKTGDTLVIVDPETAQRVIEDAPLAFDMMDKLDMPYLKMDFTREQADAMRAGAKIAQRKRTAETVTALQVQPRLSPAAAAPAITQHSVAAASYAQPDNLASLGGATEPQPSALQSPDTLTVAPSTAPAPSSSSQALERMRAATGAQQSIAPTQPRFVESDRYTQAHEAYAVADQELSRHMAARTKLGIFAGKKTREAIDADIDASVAAYENAAKVFDTIQIEKWRNNGVVENWKQKDPALTDEHIEEKLTQKLAHYHTAKLRLHNIHTQGEFRDIKKFGILSTAHDALSERYAGLGKKTKIAVGIGIAAAGGLLGVAGAAAGVIGAAGVVGAKVYKTYAQTRSGLYANVAPVERVDSKDANGRLKSADQLRTETTARMKQSRGARIENADTTNARARKYTLASAALLGFGLLSQLDTVRDAAGQVGEWWKGADAPLQPEGNNSGNTEDVVTPPAPEAPTPVPVPEAPPAPQPMEFSDAARTVVAGEGFYNTFAEMGIISPTEQANLLRKVGPELVARGWAYPMADGTYGISRPGALPQDVLELIQKSR